MKNSSAAPPPEDGLAERDCFYMRAALTEAAKAAEKDEVPVGAVVVHRGELIGRGYNRREEFQSPTAHAEILAISEAAARLQSWRLEGCTLYVTLEPCLMCAGAIIQARVARVVFGCVDPKAGAVESLYRVCEDTRLNHKAEVARGVLEGDCAKLLREFFARLRTKKESAASA